MCAERLRVPEGAVRLDYLFDIDMRYVGETVDLRPHGDGIGEWFGVLEGAIRGPRLTGRLRWANHSRQREDGVWCPDAHGVVTTDDGAQILMTMRGYNIPAKVSGERGSVVATCTFSSSEAKYRWLNNVIAVVEGTRDPERNETRLKAYACVNETITRSPTLA
ncbi:MAG TPA: DUF3237 family protein [bacterium]